MEKRKDEPTTTVAEEKEEEEEEDKKRLDEDEEEVFDNEVDGGEAITHPMNLCTLQKYEIMKVGKPSQQQMTLGKLFFWNEITQWDKHEDSMLVWRIGGHGTPERHLK